MRWLFFLSMAWIFFKYIQNFLGRNKRKIKTSAAKSKPIRPYPEFNLAPLPDEIIILDLETTGLNPARDEIIEIGAIRFDKNSDTHKSFQCLVKPENKIPEKITEITHITQEMVEAKGIPLHEAMTNFQEFIEDLQLVTFNADFDMGFIHNSNQKCNLPKIENKVVCALKMAKKAFPGRKSYRLISLAKDGGFASTNHHRALADCEMALNVYASAVTVLRSATP